MIERIIHYIDEFLERTGEPTITPVMANKLLEKAGILNDSISKPGLPLRKLLREKKIPHAFQEPPIKKGKWFIPHS